MIIKMNNIVIGIFIYLVTFMLSPSLFLETSIIPRSPLSSCLFPRKPANLQTL